MTRTIVWSSGGGVQSVAIAGLICSGKLPKPEYCGIVDTERESRLVWEYHEAVLVPELAKIGVKYHKIPKSEFTDEDVWQERENTELPRVNLPVFVDTPTDGGGKLTTICSIEWKQVVFRRWLRSKGVQSCTSWLGMSLDEVSRTRQSKLDWYWHHYPLVFDVPMRRGECIRFVTDQMGWPEPPKSACWMCPNRDDAGWLRLKTATPDEFQKAVAFDYEMRNRRPDFYLHRSLKPLDQVDFTDTQSSFMIGGNCESGYCFV